MGVLSSELLLLPLFSALKYQHVCNLFPQFLQKCLYNEFALQTEEAPRWDFATFPVLLQPLAPSHSETVHGAAQGDAMESHPGPDNRLSFHSIHRARVVFLNNSCQSLLGGHLLFLSLSSVAK
ncbi:UNVERIFIED_CONTAM: hypothetical protein K2H54_055928 [Gekko kuhli]